MMAEEFFLLEKAVYQEVFKDGKHQRKMLAKSAESLRLH